jgi:hypothetical protein
MLEGVADGGKLYLSHLSLKDQQLIQTLYLRLILVRLLRAVVFLALFVNLLAG